MSVTSSLFNREQVSVTVVVDSVVTDVVGESFFRLDVWADVSSSLSLLESFGLVLDDDDDEEVEDDVEFEDDADEDADDDECDDDEFERAVDDARDTFVAEVGDGSGLDGMASKIPVKGFIRYFRRIPVFKYFF